MKTLITISCWWILFKIATGCAAPEVPQPTTEPEQTEEPKSDEPAENGEEEEDATKEDE